MCCRCECEAEHICCCGISLQTGLKIIAWILLVYSCVGFLLYSIFFILLVTNNASGSLFILLKLTGIRGDVSTILLLIVQCVITWLMFVLGIIMNSLLICGVSKAQAETSRIQIWIVYAILLIIFECIALIISFTGQVVADLAGELIMGFSTVLWTFFILFIAYGLVLAISLLKHIRDPSTGYSQSGNMPFGQPGYMQPGNMQYSYMQGGYMQPGNMQPGYMEYGNMQPGYTPYANMQPQPENMQPGSTEMQPQAENMQPPATKMELQQPEKASP